MGVGQDSEAGELLFEAVIVPHRSLSRRGMVVLIGAICSLSAGVTTMFWMLGAWPVAGFNGADVAIAVALLRVNARARRARELVQLTGRELRIERTDRRGKRSERRLAASWISAVLVERPGSVPALLLTSHGVREEIGRSLGEAEKRDLAGALRAALHRARNPVFDNPQLRPDAV